MSQNPFESTPRQRPEREPEKQEELFGDQEEEAEKKEKRWSEIKQEVDRVKDRLGTPVDEGIKESVVALKANGFGTTGSCEGHLDSGRGYPWILVESPLAESLDRDARYNKLQEKARHAQKEEGEPLTAAERDEVRKLVEAQIEANEKEYGRLSRLLEEFYKSSREHGRKYPARLVIEKGPWNQSWLVPEGVHHIGRRAQREPDPRSRATKFKALALYKGEMERFTKFLRGRFFGG